MHILEFLRDVYEELDHKNMKRVVTITPRVNQQGPNCKCDPRLQPIHQQIYACSLNPFMLHDSALSASYT